jgi:hypothetical protein
MLGKHSQASMVNRVSASHRKLSRCGQELISDNDLRTSFANKAEPVEPVMAAQAFPMTGYGVMSWQGHQDVGC